MSVARVFRPDNRLAKILDGADPASAQELVAAAEGRVTELGESLRGYVREKLPVILSFQGAREDELFGGCRILGEAALGVAEVAGAANMGAIGEIARGLSAMVAGLDATGAWHSEAVKVHIDALAIVSRGDGARTPENDIVLARLAAMRSALGVAE
jgi:hypothetical protein